MQTTRYRAHKCVGTQDNVHGTKILDSPRGQACSCADKNKGDRGHSSSLEPHALAQYAPLGGRLSVLTKAFPRGMETPPRGDGTDLVQIRQGQCRFVRPRCIAHCGGSYWRHPAHLGCSRPYLPNQSPACISSNFLASSNLRQGLTKQPQTTAGGSQLPKKTMVSMTPQ